MTMRSVDFHQHLWPEAFVAALARRTQPPRLRRASLELANGETWEVDLASHELDTRLSVLARDGIDVAVISLSPALGIRDLPSDDAAELEGAYEAGVMELAESSGGRLVPLAAAPRAGFAGVCMSARALQDLDRISGPLAALEADSGILFVHPGPATSARPSARWWNEIVDYTSQMQAAYAHWLAEGVERWPRLKVVFAILAGGWPFQLERLTSRGIEARTTLHENVFFETSSYGRRALELSLATFGVRQLVYGSDIPVIDSKPTLDAVRGFGDAVADALCRENPARLLT
jgi:6-methylsalicylate decarboxylase